MSTATRSRRGAAILLALVAACGFVAGIIADRLMLAAAPAAAAAEVPDARDGFTLLLRGRDTPQALGGGRFGIVLPGSLADELDLTPGQQAAIERILAEDQAVMRELTEQFQPALAAVVERTRQRIHEVLTEEQLERWQQLPGRRLRVLGPDTARD